MNKILYYYGVEEDKLKNQKAAEYNSKASFSGQMPAHYYNKGVHAYKLKDCENEAEVRKQIEERCKKNPDCSPIIMTQFGMKLPYFYWIDK